VAKQGGAFQQAAKSFLTDAVMHSFASAGIFHGLVGDFQAFELHNAEVFLASLPNLVLRQLHLSKLSEMRAQATSLKGFAAQSCCALVSTLQGTA